MAIWDLLTKRRPDRRLAEDPSNRVGIHLTQTNRTTINYQNAITAENATCHPVVFRCLHKIGMAVAGVRWYAEPDPTVPQGQRATARDIKAINDTLACPTDMFTPFMLRYWAALNFALLQRVGFKAGIGTEATLNGLYPLRPGKLEAKFDGMARLVGYEYGDTQKAESLPSRRAASPAGDMNGMALRAYAFEITCPGFMGELDYNRVPSVLSALGRPADIISMLMQRAQESARGNSNVKHVIVLDQSATSDQIDRIDDFLAGSSVGGKESGETLVLSNTKADVHTFDNGLGDIHTKIPSDDMARHICGILGVPVSLAGITSADAAKFTGNFSESRAAFYQDTIIPGYLNPLADGLTAGVCPYGARIRFATDEIPALEAGAMERKKVQSETLENLSKVTFLTDDEKREMCGYEALTDDKRAQLTAPQIDNSGASNEPVG